MNRWARARGPRGWLTVVGVAALVLGLAAAANAPARAGPARAGGARQAGRVPAASQDRQVSGTAPIAFP